MYHIHPPDIVRLVVAGAVLYLGAHRLALYLRDREETVYLWVAGWCGLAATFLVTRAVLHSGVDADTAGYVVRLVPATLFAQATLAIGASRAMIRRPPSASGRVMLAASLVPVAFALFSNWVFEFPPNQRIDLFGDSFWTGNPGPLFAPTVVCGIAVGIYCVYLIVEARIYVDRVGRLFVAIPGSVMMAALINDSLLAGGTIVSLQLSEYAVAALAFGIGYAQVRRSTKYFESIATDGAMRTRLIEKVIEAQERERKRIARDLHDATGQSLTSLSVRLRALEGASEIESVRAQVSELRQLTRLALEEVRRIAQGLHPVALDDLGFEEAVRAYIDEFASSHGLTSDVHMHGLTTKGRLPAPVEIVLYRIVQEALTNVVKHADAGMVSVLVDRQSDKVRVIVEDDGSGFDAEATTGLGLLSIRERAALCDGDVTIESKPGSGTTIYVTIPL